MPEGVASCRRGKLRKNWSKSCICATLDTQKHQSRSLLLQLKSSVASGVATGWTGVDMSTPLLLEVAAEIDTDPTSFCRGVGRAVAPPPDPRYRLALAMSVHPTYFDLATPLSVALMLRAIGRVRVRRHWDIILPFSLPAFSPFQRISFLQGLF